MHIKKFLLAALALVALTGTAFAEQVACPATATAAACAEHQAIHDYVTAHPAYGPNPVFATGAADPRTYLGSDPDANVRLALRRSTFDGGAVDKDGK